MKDGSRSFLNGENTAEDEDIDELFSQLQQFTPPTNMVERIMQAVGHLPLPQLKANEAEHYFEGLLVNETHKQPS